MATTADSVAALTEERAFPGKIIRECGAELQEGEGGGEGGGGGGGWVGVGVT